jgi:Heme/copper-type cytochrome/quinol oxidase, subunit 3
MSSTIPYTIERHPQTGLNNVRLGVWLFLASEVMLFGGLFSAYFMLRSGAPEPWLPLRDHLGAAGRNTLVLLAGTATFMQAPRSARAALSAGAVSRMLFVGSLFASMLFALAFCASKMSEYYSLFGEHIGPGTSTQYATYFLLTGVHLLHVVAGGVVTLWLALTSARTWRTSPSTVVNRLEATALYWYFVDAIWLVLVVLLYVV